MTTEFFTKQEAQDAAQEVGGTAHPLDPYAAPEDRNWYVLGERSANTRTRSVWTRGTDGRPSLSH